MSVVQGPMATRADGSGAMFDQIASRYDRLNRILSLGLDRGWRRAAVAALQLRAGARVLDVATGTGDLALAIVEGADQVTVVGSDPSAKMLEVAEAKRGCSPRGAVAIQLEVDDAQDLGHADDSFDGAAIAFGIRNVPDRLGALREMVRVTRAGGRVVVLELSEPGGGLLSSLARIYVQRIVPRIGALLSGAKEYRYLQQSIAAFPAAAEFAAMMEEAGLVDVEVRPLTFGTCHVYAGCVPARTPAPEAGG